MPQKRFFIKIPFSDKDEAKKLGALWDSDKKSWYIPKHIDKNLFKKWLESSSEIGEIEILESFKSALQQQNLIIDDYPIMDGKIHRAKVDGDKGNKKSGAYLGFLDKNPAGFIQNFKTGIKVNWKFECENYKIHTPKKINSQKLQEREKNLLALQEKTAQKLNNEYKNAKELSKNHPYIQKKKIMQTFKNIKEDEFGNILIPLQDISGKIWSLQRIYPNGSKIIGVIKSKQEIAENIEYSARKKGCFCLLGAENLENLEEFNIAEGFATCATLCEVLQKPMIMAVDSGNLKSVAEALKSKFGDVKINIFADNDIKQEIRSGVNIGLQKAWEVKFEFNNVNIFFPNLTKKQIEVGFSDFNDIFVELGSNEVKSQIEPLKIHHNLQESEIANLKLASQQEYYAFVDNVLSGDLVRLKNAPNMLYIADLNKNLSQMLNLEKSRVYLKKNDLHHCRPMRKEKYNQSIGIEILKDMPKIISESTNAYIDIEHSNFFLAKNIDNHKIATFHLNKDRFGNYVITTRKVLKEDLKKYRLVGSGIEPHIKRENHAALPTVPSPTNHKSNDTAISVKKQDSRESKNPKLERFLKSLDSREISKNDLER